MRNSLSILFMSFLFILTGCMKENRDNCPPTTHILFHYQADGETNVIDKYIDVATLFVYNSKGDIVQETQLNRSQLHIDGIEVYLPFGEYTLVCWGNIGEHTEIANSDNSKTARVHAPGFTTSQPIATNDALYMGSLPLSIRKGEDDQTKRLDFHAAHINLEIYVRSSKEPVVQVHHLMPQYTMFMEDAQPFETTYSTPVTYIEEHKAYGALLNVFRFKNNNPIVVNVHIPGQTGALSSITIQLKDFMKEQMPPLTVEGKQEVTIPILVEFSDLNVICKIPEWLIETGFPGIE